VQIRSYGRRLRATPGRKVRRNAIRIKEAKPNILLTNFMMLELLMTRQSTLDRAVIANADGLDYIVLDELPGPRSHRGVSDCEVPARSRQKHWRGSSPSATTSSDNQHEKLGRTCTG